MSEVKGSLLTIVLALAVFGMVFAIVKGAIKDKAEEISLKIDEAGKEAAPAVPAAATSVFTYTY